MGVWERVILSVVSQATGHMGAAETQTPQPFCTFEPLKPFTLPRRKLF
jgi:hypothetical protein